MRDRHFDYSRSFVTYEAPKVHAEFTDAKRTPVIVVDSDGRKVVSVTENIGPTPVTRWIVTPRINQPRAGVAPAGEMVTAK